MRFELAPGPDTRHTLALLLSAAALVSPAGCLFVGAGGGWADNWSVPAPMQVLKAVGGA